MAGTWYCLKCYKNMGDSQYCPYCGAHRLGDMAMSESEARVVLANASKKIKKQRKGIRPIFSDFETLIHGLYPEDDQEYKEFLETSVMLGLDK